MKISKETSSTMKGMAIMSIVIHNFLHLEQFGLVQENEMYFYSERSLLFFQHVQALSYTLVYDIFSFMGWCGVPVFVFLSGYGLSMKYCIDKGDLKWKQYVAYNYKKLLLLVLPATIFLVIVQYIEGDYLKIAFSLFSSFSFCNTLISISTSIPSAAPPYWYFALTFQLYLIYLLLFKIKRKSILLLIALSFLFVQFVLSPDIVTDEGFLRYVRKNAIGWLPVFIMGILMARQRNAYPTTSNLLSIIVTLLSFILLFIMNLNYISWIIMPFVAVIFFYSLSQVINRTNVGYAIGNWLGVYSAYIFVTHPIGILAMQWIMRIIDLNYLWQLTLLYMIITLCLSLLYRKIHLSLKMLIDKQ